MFARVLELTSRPGRLRDVVLTLRERVAPLLSAQPGFVESYILASDAEPDRIVAFTLWTHHRHADWFYRRHYSRVRRLLEPMLEFEPIIRTFTVENSYPDGRRTSREPRAARELRT